MFAIYARYRGRATRRAELVERSAAALSTLPGIGQFEVMGVEDICAVAHGPEASVAIADVTMALVSAGEWAIGLAVLPEADDDSQSETVRVMAGNALGSAGKVNSVKVRVGVPPSSSKGSRELKAQANTWAFDIAAAFTLLAAVLAKRTAEGREATAYMRRGFTQIEAAEELGITKQAMSQRLQAAGWQAETAGWKLAVDLLHKAETSWN